LLIANPELETEDVLELKRTKKPYTLVDRSVSGMDNYVVLDDKYGGKLATNHLVELGHKNITHISGPLFTATGLNRYQGYRGGLNENNINLFPTTFRKVNIRYKVVMNQCRLF